MMILRYGPVFFLCRGQHSRRIIFLAFGDLVVENSILDPTQTRRALGLAFLMMVGGGWGDGRFGTFRM
jgi:hypothetical protein